MRCNVFGITSAVTQVIGCIEEEKAFQRGLDTMPPEGREHAKQARCESMARATEERRHREMAEATRGRNHGVLGFIFGMILGRGV